MVGNSNSVTAAPTRTSGLPSPTAGVAVPRPIAPTGKDVARAGQDLPPRDDPAPRAAAAGAVRKLNELMAERQRSLSFHVDEASGRTVITVRDATTAEVVRQIPAEEVLVLARALEQTGALLDAHI